MKTIIVLFIFYLCTVICFAGDIELRWEANPEPHCPVNVGTCLEGYRLYNTFSSGDYTQPYPYPVINIPAGTETVIITVNDENEEFLYFVLTAWGYCRDEASGIYYECESEFSNEVNLLDDDEVETSPNYENNGGSSGCFILTMKKEGK